MTQCHRIHHEAVVDSR